MTTPTPTSELGYAARESGWWSAVEAEATPELRWPLSVDVYDRMRRQDAQVQSVLRAVTLPVQRTTWAVEQGAASDEVAQFVAENLGLRVAGKPEEPLPRTRDRFSWQQHIRQALLMIVYGHMFFEQVYRIEADGRAHLRKLAPRMPRTLSAINVAADGGLESIEQHPPSGARPQTVKIPVDRLVAYVHDREGGDWFGQSLLRSCYKNWLLKDRLLRVQAQTIDRNGMGVPIYKGDPDLNGEDKASGLKLAQDFRSGETAGGWIPAGADMTLLGVTGTLPDAEPAIRYHDEQIGRSVLAHFLNLNSMGGSYALAQTQAETFVQSLQALAQSVADVATQHIVEDLVDINFGPEVPAPRVTFQEIGSRHPATAEAIRALVDSGVLLREPALERWARETYGLPEKEAIPPGSPLSPDNPNTTNPPANDGGPAA